MTTMTRTVSVMHLESIADDVLHGLFAEFSNRASGDDPSMPDRTLDLPVADWHDLGEPDTITVTIEPGDKLNN